MAITKRNTSYRDLIINDIIDCEWSMFDKVNNQGGRAACQDDYDTFYIMRYSQHSSLSDATINCYRRDVTQAMHSGRNLITEKYAYMMEFTDPAYYNANLRDKLPPVSDETAALIAEIVGRQLIYHAEFARRYPNLANAGRPVDQNTRDTSIKAYSVGELRTYSLDTLKSFLEDVKRDPEMIINIQKTMVSFYGFSSLEDAEAAQARGAR